MATYSVNAAKTITGGETALFTMPSFSVPSGEEFKRLKITIVGGDYTGFTLRGDSANYSWNTWSTDTENVHWSGGTSKVWVSSGTTRSVRIQITFETEELPKYNITCIRLIGGTLTASKSQSTAGKLVTLYPTPATGYELASLATSPSVTINSNNKFTMPSSNIIISATWRKISYAITKKANPTGAGTVSGASSANQGTSVTVTQTPATGYFFNGWTISAGTISSGGTFTMPGQAVTVTANYLRRSTATLNKSTLKGGENALLTISTEKSTYTHKYQLSFGTGMETAQTDVAAGVTSVKIAIPANWANQITSAATKAGGTLTVWTYNGTTLIGSYQITGLTYQVPDDAVPVIGEILKSIALTAGGKTFNSVGDHYAQNHCGVRIQTDAEGSYEATITGIEVKVKGYTGAAYTGTAQDDEIDFTSGILTIAGNNEIEVTATDSRGRTATETVTVEVEAYSSPSGSLFVWRVDQNGNEDDTDVYAKFALEKHYTQIGTNTLTAKLNYNGTQETTAQTTDFLLPSSHLTFNSLNEHVITLILQDNLETTVISAILPSAKFIIHVAADGDRIAFFKALAKSVPTGKDSLIEISGNTQIYIGNKRLEDLLVMTEAQVLDSSAMQQARTNIGAVSAADMAAINKAEDIGTFNNLAAFTTKIDALVEAAPGGSFISAGYIVWTNAAQNIGCPFSGHVFIMFRGANRKYVAVAVVDNSQTGIAFLTKVNGTWKSSWKKITAT